MPEPDPTVVLEADAPSGAFVRFFGKPPEFGSSKIALNDLRKDLINIDFI